MVLIVNNDELRIMSADVLVVTYTSAKIMKWEMGC